MLVFQVVIQFQLFKSNTSPRGKHLDCIPNEAQFPITLTDKGRNRFNNCFSRLMVAIYYQHSFITIVKIDIYFVMITTNIFTKDIWYKCKIYRISRFSREFRCQKSTLFLGLFVYYYLCLNYCD